MTAASLLSNFRRKKKRSLLFKGKKLGHVFTWKATRPTRRKMSTNIVRREDTVATEDARVKIDKSTEEMMRVEVSNFIVESGGAASLFAVARALQESHAVMVMHKNAEDQDEDELVQELAHLSLKEGVPTLKSALHSLELRVGSTSKKITNWQQARDEYLVEVLSFPTEETITPTKQKPILTDVAKYMKRIREATRKEARREVQLKSYGRYQQVAKSVLPEQPPDLVDDGAAEKKVASQLAQVDAAHTQRLEQAYQEREIRKTPQAVKDIEHQLEAEEMASSLLRPLSDEEQEIVRDAMYGTGPNNEIVAQVGTDSVQRISMHRLQPGQWLNDEVIHYFMVMLANRDEELCRLDPSKKRSHFFKSFFITKLLDIGNANPNLDGKYNYRNVKRWSKKVPGKDIFALDKVFFPINVGGVHWICVVAFISEKRIQCYDSMASSGIHYLKSIFQYLQDEHLAKKDGPIPDLEEWELVDATRGTPQQLNGFDCGVFTCMFADFLSKDCPLVFSQEHVTQCRERIALSIMNGAAIM